MRILRVVLWSIWWIVGLYAFYLDIKIAYALWGGLGVVGALTVAPVTFLAGSFVAYFKFGYILPFILQGIMLIINFLLGVVVIDNG